MQKTESKSRFATRAKYEAPQTVCFQCETEGGILATSSDPINASTTFGLKGQETETSGSFWDNQ